MEMLDMVVASVPAKVVDFLAQSGFWPGPLTILFPKKVANGLFVSDRVIQLTLMQDTVPTAVTAGQPTVAVRMPSHLIAQQLIALSGRTQSLLLYVC